MSVTKAQRDSKLSIFMQDRIGITDIAQPSNELRLYACQMTCLISSWKLLACARRSEKRTISPIPPVISSKARSTRPPSMASYEPYNLQERYLNSFYLKNSYLAKAFSSSEAHISFFSWVLWQKIRPMSGWHGNRSSITTSYQCPYSQNRKWNIPLRKEMTGYLIIICLLLMMAEFIPA